MAKLVAYEFTALGLSKARLGHGKRSVRPGFRRHCARNERDRSGSVAARLGSALGQNRDAVLPRLLLSKSRPPSNDDQQATPPKAMTVYSVRITTSTERGSELSSAYGGISLCLIGKDGSSLLHRFSPVTDEHDLKRQLNDICQSDVWEEAGADCSISEASVSPTKKVALKRRFAEGSVDEESFLGPELGPLSALIVGPEEGTWRLHEINICSSRSGHNDRFVCRERMGDGVKDRSAIYLTPVPEDAVVYGSGESAVILSKEEAAKVYSRGMQDYADMKQQLLQINVALIGGFSGVAGLIGGVDALLPFLSGGMLGLLYQLSVQSAVDSLPLPMKQSFEESPMDRSNVVDVVTSAVSDWLSRPSTRFLMTAGLAYIAFTAADIISGSNVEDKSTGTTTARLVQNLMIIAAGFLTHKISLIAVTLQPQETEVVLTSATRRKGEVTD